MVVASAADLDDTLYPGNTGLGPALKRNIDEFLQAKLGVSAERAAAMRVELFRTHGSSLAGLIVSSPSPYPGPEFFSLPVARPAAAESVRFFLSFSCADT